MASIEDTIAKLQQQASGVQQISNAATALEAQIAKEQEAIANLATKAQEAEAKLAKMMAVDEPDVQGIYKMRDAIEALEAEAAKAKEGVAQLEGARGLAQQADAANRTRDLAAAQKENAESFDASGISIGHATEALKSAGPEGFAVAMALQVATAGFVAFAAAMAGGIAMAIQVNEELDLMSARFEALAGSSKAGDKVFDMVMKLGQELPFATAQIGQWAMALQSAGVAGKDLEAATRAIAAAEAIRPGEGAQAATEMLSRLAGGGKAATEMLKQIQEQGGRGEKMLRRMGIGMDDLGGKTAVASMKANDLAAAIEKALQKRGAGPMEAMAATWPVIFQKAKEGLASLFDDLGPNVKDFMGAVKSLFGEFSKGGSAIAFLKPIITSVFGALLDWGTKAITAVRSGLLDLIIWILKTRIALDPVIKKIKEFAESESFITGLKTAFTLLGVALGIVMIPFAAIMTAITLIGIGIGVLAAGVTYVAGAIVSFFGPAISAMADWISGAASAAYDFVAGLVNGIVAGAGQVASAVADLAKGALSAFTSVFGIRSPSTVMYKHMRVNVAGAAASGLDDGSDEVQSSMAAMADPRALAKGKGGAGGAAGKSVTFSGCTFTGGAVERTVRAAVMMALDEEADAGPELELAPA